MRSVRRSGEAVEADWRTAPIDERLRAMLGFIEKLTLRPDELGPEDADAVRAAGVSDEAMVDAIHVARALQHDHADGRLARLGRPGMGQLPGPRRVDAGRTATRST